MNEARFNKEKRLIQGKLETQPTVILDRDGDWSAMLVCFTGHGYNRQDKLKSGSDQVQLALERG